MSYNDHYIIILTIFLGLKLIKGVSTDETCETPSSSLVDIDLKNDGPIIPGETITFKANFTIKSNERHVSGKCYFEWKDSVNPPHKHKSPVSTLSTNSWRVTYPKNIYSPGKYYVGVRIHFYTAYNCYDYTDVVFKQFEILSA